MSENWVTKQTLIMRAKNKDDHQAWEDFVNYYESFIGVILGHLKVRPSDQDDLKQDILIKIWDNLQKFDYDPEKGKFRSWLKTLVRNKFIDSVRKKKRVQDREVMSLDNSYDTEDIATELTDEELSEIIDREWRVHMTNKAMERVEKVFSGNAIQVFKMSLDEIPTKEIARRLELSENSISKLRRRVEERLILEINRLREEIEF